MPSMTVISVSFHGWFMVIIRECSIDRHFILFSWQCSVQFSKVNSSNSSFFFKKIINLNKILDPIMDFVVAAFDKENPPTVEAFPSSWLQFNNKNNWWWPRKYTQKLQKSSGSVPYPDWTLCECRVLGYFGKLFGF
jgi:hypothetical protein